jgi:DNA-binding XRE family transcriptional regulator
MSRFTDDQVREMLSEYVRRRMSVRTFMRTYGMGASSVKCMLKGVTYAHIERPEGFVFPWPPRVRKPRKLRKFYRRSVKTQTRLLGQYVEQRMSLAEFAKSARINVEYARDILLGWYWAKAPRPEGFRYPWPEHEIKMRDLRSLTSEQVQEALVRRETEKLSQREMAEWLGVSRGSIRCILSGVTYREVARP